MMDPVIKALFLAAPFVFSAKNLSVCFREIPGKRHDRQVASFAASTTKSRQRWKFKSCAPASSNKTSSPLKGSSLSKKGVSKNIGKTPNHPFVHRGFPLFSPSILGVFPLFFGNTHIGVYPRHPKSSTYLVGKCLEPLKAEPQEMWTGFIHTSSIGGPGCLGLYRGLYLHW